MGSSGGVVGVIAAAIFHEHVRASVSWMTQWPRQRAEEFEHLEDDHSLAGTGVCPQLEDRSERPDH